MFKTGRFNNVVGHTEDRVSFLYGQMYFGVQSVVYFYDLTLFFIDIFRTWGYIPKSLHPNSTKRPHTTVARSGRGIW